MRRCRVYRVAGLLALAGSIAYSVAVVAAPEQVALLLLRLWVAAATLALGWLVYRVAWLQCPPERRAERLRELGRVPAG